ncbi:hypothetical protein [Leptospira gomenensis]|nr:hypothetical protein [Leptospira gomenensis]
MRKDLDESIRWHLSNGYRIKRIAEILEERGATVDLVQKVLEKMEKERAELARKGRESK